MHAITGSTGAGVKPSTTSHFSWRNNNVSWYKPFTHQHLGEIGETLQALQADVPEINFLPIRGNFTRGIFASVYTTFEGGLDDAYSLYEQFYANSSFTHTSKKALDLKMVVNTNNCLIHLHKHKNLLLITSCLDNLLKGASGQAVENMNLMFSWPQTTGLQLKANVH